MADAVGKAQVARDVCAASAAFASCTHRRRSPRRPPFVDWYLVLAIGEAASEDAIKRRYRHLALQLHPDKNKHPKAEVAFKIVSEAHACLIDKARRRAFDAERSAAFCAACHERARAPATMHRAADKKTPTTASAQQQRSSGAKKRGAGAGGNNGRRPPAAPTLREVQSRLRDECRVIDGCLRTNGAAALRRQSFPLFDPSDRPGYPHARPPPSPAAACRLPREFWPFEDLGAAQEQRWSRGSCESPVYQIRTAPERASRTKRPW